VGYYSKAFLDAGGEDTVASENSSDGYYGTIGDGDGNAEGAAYRIKDTGWNEESDPNVTLLKKLFTLFAGAPSDYASFQTLPRAVAGLNYNPALWDFSLGAIAGAINGGSTSYLAETYTTVAGGLAVDLNGAPRSQNLKPDMGAYESDMIILGAGGN
jgi:hypothetical protein